MELIDKVVGSDGPVITNEPPAVAREITMRVTESWIGRLAIACFAIQGSALAAHAAEGADSSMELAFLQSTMTVKLLNMGGKYVAIDLKKIPEGGDCRMDKDSTIIKVGPGKETGKTRVKYVAPQLHSGGCPFLTEFEIPDADYTSARAAFTAKTEEATKKIDEIKKDLGDKWNEATGAAKPAETTPAPATPPADTKPATPPAETKPNP